MTSTKFESVSDPLQKIFLFFKMEYKFGKAVVQKKRAAKSSNGIFSSNVISMG